MDVVRVVIREEKVLGSLRPIKPVRIALDNTTQTSGARSQVLEYGRTFQWQSIARIAAIQRAVSVCVSGQEENKALHWFNRKSNLPVNVTICRDQTVWDDPAEFNRTSVDGHYRRNVEVLFHRTTKSKDAGVGEQQEVALGCQWEVLIGRLIN